MTGRTLGGRPVYRSSRGDYLYYYQSDGSWHLGPDLSSILVAMYVDDTSMYAEDITGTWYLYASGLFTFRPNSSIRVTCVAEQPKPRPNIGAIVGIVFGVVAAVALLIAVCCYCNKSAPAATTAQNRQPVHYVGTTNATFQPAISVPPPFSPLQYPQPAGTTNPTFQPAPSVPPPFSPPQYPQSDVAGVQPVGTTNPTFQPAVSVPPPFSPPQYPQPVGTTNPTFQPAVSVPPPFSPPQYPQPVGTTNPTFQPAVSVPPPFSPPHVMLTDSTSHR
uniref:Uncharacterized protein n=1 Tax=Branchiostoma floridae TaxID=7739 RepID=C3YCN6_BRAFL|eukprot:XP_002605827.1 hypothetical protein BRAFLDRAFT_84312 [Branchiostoma floridae]